jgi:L-fucose dehydrogenase
MHRLVSLSSEMDDQQALCRAIENPQKVSQHAGLSSSARAALITGQHVFVDGGYVHLDRALT